MTHMRVRHDEKFAREIPGVDLVLGGHDHEYHCKAVELKLKDPALVGATVTNKVVPMVKSATDFLDMSEIEITFDVNKDQFEQFEEQFTPADDPKVASMTQVMFSEADQTQYVVNRIRLAEGDWDADPSIDLIS